MEPKDATKQVFTANLMPSRGSWLELEIDKKGVVYARIDRKRKLPIHDAAPGAARDDPSTGFKLDTSTNEEIPSSSTTRSTSLNTIEKDTATREDEALDRGLQEAEARRAADGGERAQPPERALLRPEAV